MREWLTRAIQPIVNLFRQGISPEKIALTIALGFVLGVTPVIGSTTALCTLAAVVFRLNLPAIQVVNGFTYPLQFVLLIPFYRMGAWIFRADASGISLSGVLAMIRANMWHAIQTLWVVTMHALVAWLISGVLTVALLYGELSVSVRSDDRESRTSGCAGYSAPALR
jgi:uncharacterized protein (DUF2062 family)